MSAAPSKAVGPTEESRLDYSTEDELSAPPKPSQHRPRHSLAGEPSRATPKATPYAKVRKHDSFMYGQVTCSEMIFAVKGISLHHAKILDTTATCL